MQRLHASKFAAHSHVCPYHHPLGGGPMLLLPPPGRALPMRRVAAGSRDPSFLRRPTASHSTSSGTAIGAAMHEAQVVRGSSGRSNSIGLPPRGTVVCQAAAITGGDAAAGSSSRHPPPQLQQITRRNFRSALPEVAAALRGCSFFAWDLEFTGLHVEPVAPIEALDDASDKYQRARQSAQHFQVVQLGLSAFLRCPATGDYTCRTFNFTVFPRLTTATNGTLAKAADRRFLCQASSLQFLATQGFDFNRWILEGIPYAPLPIQPGGATCFPAPAPAPTPVSAPLRSTPDVVAFEDQDQTQLDNTRMAESDDDGLERSLDAVKASAGHVDEEEGGGSSGFSQVLALMRSCGRPAVAHNALFDLVYTLQHFTLPPPPERWADFKASVVAWLPGGVYDTKAIASYLLLLSKKQGLFGDMSLGQLYDSLQSGGSVERFLTPRHPTAEAGSFSAAAGGNGGGQPLAGSRAVLPAVDHAPGYDLYRSPSGSSGDGGMAHEAGYDAFMTGAAFARLLRVAELLEAPVGSPLPSLVGSVIASASYSGSEPASAAASAAHQPLTESLMPTALMRASAPRPRSVPTTAPNEDPSSTFPPLAWVEALRGRLHPMRLDVPYLDLTGPEPAPQRPEVFYISNINIYTKTGEAASKFSKAGLGRVRLYWLSPLLPAGDGRGGRSGNQATAAQGGRKAALVQLFSPEGASRLLGAVRGMEPTWRVMRYAEYYAAKHRGEGQQQQQQQQQRGGGGGGGRDGGSRSTGGIPDLSRIHPGSAGGNTPAAASRAPAGRQNDGSGGVSAGQQAVGDSAAAVDQPSAEQGPPTGLPLPQDDEQREEEPDADCGLPSSSRSVGSPAVATAAAEEVAPAAPLKSPPSPEEVKALGDRLRGLPPPVAAGIQQQAAMNSPPALRRPGARGQ